MKYFQLNKRSKTMGNIVIIGAGIGGLCTGIRLQNEGFDVTIYEKNNESGGCIKYIVSEDDMFKIDESASLAINPLTYNKIFIDVGKNPQEYFQWIPLKNIYKVFTSTDKEFYLCNNLSETQEELNKYYPKDIERYTKFIFDTTYKYLIAKENILNKSYLYMKDFLNLKTLRNLVKLKVVDNADEYVKKYIKSEELQQLILFQTFFMGVSPYEIPNIYTSVAANTQIEGIDHIKGGLSAYVLGLEKLFLELGGKIKYNSAIRNLIIDNKKVKGIIYDGQLIYADKVILNVDYINGQQKLLHREIVGHRNNVSLANNKKEISLSCSTFIIHIGFSKKFSELEVHNLFLNEDFKEEIEKIFQGKLPKKPSLYIYYPSVKDDSFCKDTRDSVMNIMVRVPNLQALNIKWDENIKNELYEYCIKILESILNVNNLKSHIKFCSFTSPRDFEINYDYYKGSCFGIGHTFFQSMVFRPQIKDKKLKNLYYVGSSIHPGNGASIVMDCAKIVSDFIINKN